MVTEPIAAVTAFGVPEHSRAKERPTRRRKDPLTANAPLIDARPKAQE